jgi:asparagine synthase (glutamine-hydrolysing)
MCGIAGFLGKGDKATLDHMGAAISHRGKDQHGACFIESRNFGKVGFAHQRLAIIDLSESGRQPMTNEDDSLVITFNGEIYNFNSIKKRLSSRHVFKGNSDTEVILHLYEEFGEKTFEMLSGMFAFALYDAKKDICFLVRDRMGKKPLYWGFCGQDKKTLIFASELKCFHEYPDFKKQLSVSSLHEYFYAEHVVSPNSIFEDVFKVLPGTYMKFDGKSVITQYFWKPEYKAFSGDFDQAKTLLDATLHEAIAERLIADVPLGIFLSGGLDSSTVSWYAKEASSMPINTFSIGFEDSSFDESGFARQVAQHLGTNHHTVVVSEKELLDVVPQIPMICDEPMADASLIPTDVLSKYTAKHVTVALGGDGGDELLMGYDTIPAYKISRILDILPLSLLKKFERFVSLLPTSFSNMSLDFKVKSFFKALSESHPALRNEAWLAAFSDKEISQLFIQHDPRHSEERKKNIIQTLSDIGTKDDYDVLGRAFESLYMLEHVLVKVDRASMHHSLEVRAPFLAQGVVDLLHSFPTSFKLKGFERKYILKELMRGRLPDNIIDRKKKGFGMPVATWLNGPLAPLLKKYSESRFLTEQGLFNHAYVRELIALHSNHKKDNRKKLWTFLVFQLWWEKWML